MNITQFVDEFNSAANKKSYVSKHIINKYIPFEKKVSISKKIIEMSMYKNVGNDIIFLPDTPARYMLFIISIIQSYTDIEITDGKNTTVSIGEQNLKSFNLLEECSATEVIIAEIGTDAVRLNTILKMVLDDTVDKERSLVPFLDTKVKAMRIGLDSINDVMAKIQAANEGA